MLKDNAALLFAIKRDEFDACFITTILYVYYLKIGGQTCKQTDRQTDTNILIDKKVDKLKKE